MTSTPLKPIQPPPWSSEWVAAILAKLTARYGRDFLGRWEGVEISVVKDDWADELAGLQSRPEAIRYALENLGAKSPNVSEFRDLCRRAPDAPKPSLPAPEVNPAAVARAVAMANAAFNTPVDRLARQREYMEMELRGERISPAQRDFWRRALRGELIQRYGIDCTERGFHLDHLAEAVQRKGVYA